MLKFNDGKLTAQGKALLARVQDGQGNINFTRVVVGDGTYTSDESTEQRKALKSQKQEFAISSRQIVNDSTVVLTVAITNYKSSKDYLKEGYDITEIGIYAKDSATGSEILYSIATAATSDYMPAYDGIAPSVVNLRYSLEIANASNVTFITNGALISAGEFNKLAQKVEYLEGLVDSIITTGSVTVPLVTENGDEIVTENDETIMATKRIGGIK